MVITALIAGCGGGASLTPTSQDETPTAAPEAPTLYPTYTLPSPMAETGALRPRTVTILGIPSIIKVQVTRVIDGDTIEVQSTSGNRDTVRLLGVDTPETFRANKPNEYSGVMDTVCLDRWGIAAKSFALENLQGRTVALYLDLEAGGNQNAEGGLTFDRIFTFGRLLAFVEVEGQDFSAELVRRGLARVCTEGQSSREEEYIRLQQQAQENNAGLWSCRQGTPNPTTTPILLATVTPAPSLTATSAPAHTPTPTEAAIPAATPISTLIASPVPTPTAIPISTSTATPVPTPTAIPTSTLTATPVPTPTAIATPMPTATPVPTPTATIIPTPMPSSVGCDQGQVNVNAASSEELELIIHIGPDRATQAVQLRPFSSLDDLVRIRGIGPSRLDDIKAEVVACVGA